MRNFVSALLIFAIVMSSGIASFGQRSLLTKRNLPVETQDVPADIQKNPAKILPKVNPTSFSDVRAYTDGKGVWVQWTMSSERSNAGFYVNRTSKKGISGTISELVTGSAFIVGDEPLYDSTYTFFDPKGDLGSVYNVDSLAMSGTKLRSVTVGVTYVDDIRKVGDGSLAASGANLKNFTNAVVKNDLEVSGDLKAEIEAHLLAADPNKHKEVIAQPGVKIGVRRSGIIRVMKQDLANAGLDTNGSSTNWQLYLEGNQIPMIIGANNDYVEFLGKTLDTVESDIRTYYLINGSGPGKRFDTGVVRPGNGNVLDRSYKQVFSLKERSTYLNQILNGDLENYWGRALTGSFTSLNFNLSGIDRTPGTRSMNIKFQGFSLTPHAIELTLNGNVLSPTPGSGRQPFEGQYEIPVDYLLDGANVLQVRSNGAPGDLNLFDQMSIDFPRGQVAVSDRLDFYTDNYHKALLSGFSSPNVRLFDVTYENSPKVLTNFQVAQTGGTWGPVIPAGRGRVYYATEANNFSAPFSVKANDPEIIGDPSQGATLIIIAHESLMAQAQNWANYRAGQGISTKVVNVDEIYDEYNYGTLSSFAIEDFLNYAKNNWSTPPSYVLLMGDAFFDSRNYEGLGYWNMVPARLVNTLFVETGSDEALADFNNDGLSEIPIGRIAARTPTEAANMLTKTMAWESSVSPTSVDRGALFAYDQPDGYDFEAMSNRIMGELPAGMPKTTVLRGSANDQTTILNAINEVDAGAPANSGQFVVNYTGHGTQGAWQNSSFFSSTQVPLLTNASNPSIFTALTCLNGYFNARTESFAETLTKASNGGAVAVWASTGLTTPDVQEIMARRFFSQISAGNINRLGDLIADAKGEIGGGGDVRLSWALLGDPMLKVR